MGVVFPRGEIADNSMATAKQQQTSRLAFVWGQREYMLFRNQVNNEVFGCGRTTISQLSWSAESVCVVTELSWLFGVYGCVCVCILNENVSPII